MFLVGIPAEVVVTVGSINLIYQFWVHTEHIGKLGWFEKIFITASNHRVHHAQNDIYLDKNYGGLFWLNRGGSMDRVPKDAYWASGFMGQTTMVIPSRDVVIVRLGPSPGGFRPYLNETVGRILDSIGPPS